MEQALTAREFVKQQHSNIVNLPWVFIKKEARLNLNDLNSTQKALIETLHQFKLVSVQGELVTSGPARYCMLDVFKTAIDAAERKYIHGFETMWMKLPWKKANETKTYKPRGIDIFIDADDLEKTTEGVSNAFNFAKKTGLISIDMENPFRAERKSFWLATHPALCELLQEKLKLPDNTVFNHFGRKR